MSQEDLVSAYVDGHISRRTLIRRLVAGGVSLGAATAYAQLITPKAQAQSRGFEPPAEYPRTYVKILDSNLTRVRESGKLRVSVRMVEAGNINLYAYKGDALLGHAPAAFVGASTLRLSIPLGDIGPLRGGRKARVKVEARYANASEPTVAVARKKLVKPRRKKGKKGGKGKRD